MEFFPVMFMVKARRQTICSKRGKQNEPEFPSLDKEGWLRPLKKCREASIAGADGVVGSSHRLSEVEPTTPAAPPKERDRLFDGAATPPFQGGEWAFPTTAI